MSCEGLTGTEARFCRAVQAAQQAAEAATALAQGRDTVGQIVALAEAAAALAIPLALILLIVKLWPVMRGIFETRRFTVKMGPFELSAQEATDQLRLQIDDLQAQVASLIKAGQSSSKPLPPGASFPAPPVQEDFADVLDKELGDQWAASERKVGPAPPARPARARRRILWVDDFPSNNAALIAAFEKDGIEVDLAPSTQSAMARLATGADRYGALITDQGRVEEDGRNVPDAGTRLLLQMKEVGIALPSAVFTTARGVWMRGPALDAGAELVTDSATDLRAFVFRRIGYRDED